MNKVLLEGRIIEVNYFAAAGDKKSRVAVRVLVTRKRHDSEMEAVGFGAVADFIAKGQQVGLYKPGSRICLSAYLDSSGYTDRNGKERLSLSLILEETSGEELTAEDQRWYQDYLAKRSNPAPQQSGYAPAYQAQPSYYGGYPQQAQYQGPVSSPYQQPQYQQPSQQQYQQGMAPGQGAQTRQGVIPGQGVQTQQGAFQASGYQSGNMPV